MKSKSIKSYNLPNDREISVTIDAKPYALMVILTIIGFTLTLFSAGMFPGIIVIILGCFAIIFLPRRILLEFCDEYVVVYNKANHYDCFVIYYDEIVSWTYVKKVSYDELTFELIEGVTETVECFGPWRTERILNIYAPNKNKKKRKTRSK